VAIYSFLGFRFLTFISDLGKGGVFSIRANSASNLVLSATVSGFLGMSALFDAGQVWGGSLLRFLYRFC
jgi:hypothetical protein